MDNTMIDYEKLKIAHELTIKLMETHEICVAIRISTGNIGSKDNLIARLQTDTFIDDYFNLDDLIHALKKLIQPITKFKIGQEVWYLENDNSINKFTISAIDKINNEIIYDGMCEKDLFETKEDLINYQLNYWRNAKNECEPHHITVKTPINELNDCKHISDGIHYTVLKNPIADTDISKHGNYFLKCKKCGTFFLTHVLL